MSCAYIGSALMPPVFGLVAQYLHIKYYPIYLLAFLLLTIYMTEETNKLAAHRSAI